MSYSKEDCSSCGGRYAPTLPQSRSPEAQHAQRLDFYTEGACVTPLSPSINKTDHATAECICLFPGLRDSLDCLQHAAPTKTQVVGDVDPTKVAALNNNARFSDAGIGEASPSCKILDDPSLQWDPFFTAMLRPETTTEGLSQSPARPDTTANNDSFIHMCLQLSTNQIQVLVSQVQNLEASLKYAEKQVEDLAGAVRKFTEWSAKMEKHCQETTDTVLNILKLLQKTGLFHDGLDSPKGS